MKHNCPICRSQKFEILFESKNNSLARYGFLQNENSGSIVENLNQKIAYCEHCNFGWNIDFEYSKVKYDSDQIIEAGYFSERYVEYQKKSALYLKKIMGFVPDTAVEIGAGAGIFLKAFDAKRKVAIEPSAEAAQIDKTIEIYNKYYSENDFNFQSDIVVMRQVLEHIKDPLEFLESLVRSFQKNDKFFIYIEVPNSMMTFRLGRFYDYYYEHCNYFTAKTFNVISEALNMRIVDLSTAMDGELISVLLTSEITTCSDLKSCLDLKRSTILKKLKQNILEGKKIIAWGASGNGAQILNDLQIQKSTIPFIIDSDINKQGKFIPGTLQKIISPQDAMKYSPDVVVIFTQFHKVEISVACEKLFNGAEIWVID